MRKNFHIIFLLFLILISLFTRLNSSPLFDIDYHFNGDSVARASLAMDTYLNGINWGISTIWLPLFFTYFSLPLFLHFSIESLVFFQFFISLVTIPLFYYLIQKGFNTRIAICSSFILSIMPTHARLSNTVLSEPLSLFFIIAGLFTYLLHRENKKNLYYFFTLFSFLSLSLIRYEGTFFFFAFTFYEVIFNKRYKSNFINLAIFLIGMTYYEFLQYNQLGVILHGLLSNNGDSTIVNDLIFNINSLSDILARLTLLIRADITYLFYFSFFGALIYIYKHRSLFFLPLTFLFFFIMVFLGTLKSSVTLFDRYWLITFVLSIPFIFYFFDLLLNKIKISSKLLLLPVALYLYLIYPLHPLTNTIYTSGMRQAVNYLKSQEMLNLEFFIDDINTRYMYEAFYAFATAQGKVDRCCNLDTSLYLKSKLTISDEIDLKLEELFTNNKTKILILLYGSPLHKKLNKNLLLNKYSITLIKQFNDVLIYSKN